MILRLFYCLSLSFLCLCFTPVWIGPEFSEKNLITYKGDEELEEICGRQRESNETEYPWAVSVIFNDQNRLGGSIISPYHILTVAHGFLRFTGGETEPCVNKVYRNISDLRRYRSVVYGGKCIRGKSKRYPNHPECQKPDVTYNKIRSVLVDGDFAIGGCHYGHDWAILELENKIRFSDKVRPICLPGEKLPDDDVMYVAGWGRSSVFAESGPHIHEIPMRIDPFCRRPGSDKMPIDANDYLCATSLNISDYSVPRTCHGDSGSGMEWRDEKGRSHLIALTSFGTQGCPANELARFTRIGPYLRQICAYTGICYSKKL